MCLCLPLCVHLFAFARARYLPFYLSLFSFCLSFSLSPFYSSLAICHFNIAVHKRKITLAMLVFVFPHIMFFLLNETVIAKFF